MKDILIYRKPTVTYTKSFEEIIQVGRSVANREEDSIGTSFICESLPKNAFLRLDNFGNFKIYFIKSNGDIKEGGNCILSMRLATSFWTTTKDLNDVFSALDTATGVSFSLKELLRKNIDARKERYAKKMANVSEKTE